MKIINLQIENIKKLVAIDIKPNSNLIKISGKNGAGKSSVLDAIWWALGGTKTVQDKPIRNGQKHANIKLDLGELKVERRFTSTGSTLFVTDTTGSKLKSPQAVLDKLLGLYSFDPLAFMHLSSSAQLSYLKEIVGLDFIELDAEIDLFYNQRTEANRTMKDIDTQLGLIEIHPDTPKKPVIITDLMAQLKEANDVNQQLEAGVLREVQLNKEMTLITKRLEALEHELISIEEYAGNNSLIDESVIEDKIANAETLNRHLANAESHELLIQRKEKGRIFIQNLTDKMTVLNNKKKSLLSQAAFPVDGLAFNDTTITYDAIPLDQASFAEQLKISTAMAMAFNPELRVIRITDGSMLDSNSMAVIEKIAIDNDFQVWIEIVDDSQNVGLYIEDGSVIKNNERGENAA